MKFRDMLIDYCEYNGLRIVSILNLPGFIAVSHRDNVKDTNIIHPAESNNSQDTIIVRYLSEKKLKSLFNNELTVEDLYKKAWMELDDFEHIFNRARKMLVRTSQSRIAANKEQNDIQDDSKIINWFIKMAEAGEPYLMFQLGILYADGRGVPQDDAKAVYWYEKAAEGGTIEAMQLLGSMYEQGRGTQQDPNKSAYWYQKASAIENPDVILYLGDLYKKGSGVTVDHAWASHLYTKAARICEKTANDGDMWAMETLASLYEEGKGVAKDPAKAIFWYQESARAGNNRVMKKLSSMYENGNCVAKNHKMAKHWRKKAERAKQAEVSKMTKRSGEESSGMGSVIALILFILFEILLKYNGN